MMDTISTQSHDLDMPFLLGGGELAGLIAQFDWASTPLGSMEGWPQRLKTTIALILRSPVAIVTLWGEAGVMIYNDAYSVFAGARHPRILGSNVRQGWAEVAEFNDNVMRVCLAGGTLAYRDQALTLYRDGRPGQAWMNLDYSPLLDESGTPCGVMAIVVETTEKVRAEQRLQEDRQRLQHLLDADEALRQSEQGLRRAQEAGGVGLFSLTLDDDVMHVTAQFCRIFGVAETAMVSAKTIEQLIIPEDRSMASDSHTRNRRSAALNVEYRIRRNDSGEKRVIARRGEFEHDESGKAIRLVGVVQDITERRHAQRALRESEAKFRALAQAMPNHVWTAPPNGRLDWFNERIYQYCGVGEGELDEGRWTHFVHPDDIGDAAELWIAAVSADSLYQTEFRLRRGDGSYRWHIVRAVPIRDEAGATIYWIGTNTDVEELRAAREALEYLNVTLEQQVADRTADRDRMWRLSTDIMLVADFSARVVATNPALTSALGWMSSEVLGRSFMDLVHPDDVASTMREVGRLSEGVKTFTFVNRYQHKDGGYRTLSWTAVPDDSFIHAVGRDVTAEHAAAEALKQAAAALQQAQKMEAIGNLTGGVAHDFNNLLQVVSGNLQLLAKDIAGNERAERRVANARAGVERGAKLASQLLAFGRRQALDPRVVNIGRFVIGIDEILRRTIGEGIEIRTIVADGLWNTLVDTAQIENALLNLAINARDAMDGVGRLTIEAGNVEIDAAYAGQSSDLQPGQYVTLSVTDTGSGMAPGILSKVFEPFFSTKPEGKGTGLGLSMVYGFVKQSGGHVRIYSEVEQGTTIRIYLPRSLQSEDVTLPADTDPVVGGRETVLVAEDDEGVRATAIEMLTDLGYTVLMAVDADSALVIISSGAAVDLLFTDVIMPGTLKSPELARLAQERLPDLAVLFTSGYTENSIVHGGRLDEGVQLLSKPYTREQLARKIRHVLDKRVIR